MAAISTPKRFQILFFLASIMMAALIFRPSEALANKDWLKTLPAGFVPSRVGFFAVAARCGRYSKDLSTFGSCASGAWDLANALEIRTLMPVAFYKDLKTLVKDERVQRFLAETHHLLTQDSSSNKSCNLWETALSATNSNEKEATLWMAVLFQDLGKDATHLNLLEIEPQFAKLSAVSKLKEVLVLLAEDRTQKKCGKFPGPANIKDELLLKTGMYHFYVPAYLTQKLMQQKNSPKMSSFLPFVLDSTYKLRQLQSKNIYSDPATVEDSPQAKSRNTVPAIYLAYVGARWGTQTKDPLPSYEEFHTAFRKSIPNFMSRELAEAH